MSTIVLLSMSNVFMTFAWYGHLKYGHSWPLWKAILVSWGIALFEYCLACRQIVSAMASSQDSSSRSFKRLLHSRFMVFAITFLKEKLAWNYLVAFALLGCAAFFAFAFKAPGPAA